MAGLEDSAGLLVEFMNTFVFKIIFNFANKLRIIAPLTKPQVTESRGQGARR